MKKLLSLISEMAWICVFALILVPLLIADDILQICYTVCNIKSNGVTQNGNLCFKD